MAFPGLRYKRSPTRDEFSTQTHPKYTFHMPYSINSVFIFFSLLLISLNNRHLICTVPLRTVVQSAVSCGHDTNNGIIAMWSNFEITKAIISIYQYLVDKQMNGRGESTFHRRQQGPCLGSWSYVQTSCDWSHCLVHRLDGTRLKRIPDAHLKAHLAVLSLCR